LRRFKAIFVTLLFAPLATAQSLPPGRGRDTVKRVCTKCHESTVFTTQHHTKAEWQDIVQEMQNAGAKGSKADFRKIVDYLEQSFGPRMNTNKHE
jgi:cytochrome c5